MCISGPPCSMNYLLVDYCNSLKVWYRKFSVQAHFGHFGGLLFSVSLVCMRKRCGCADGDKLHDRSYVVLSAIVATTAVCMFRYSCLRASVHATNVVINVNTLHVHGKFRCTFILGMTKFVPKILKIKVHRTFKN